ncbi:hypothetical protein FBQ85_04495 [Cytophagia bacterium CHB2]|nr:hypothetical protein [Cytophagia bacterium CHB2]
MALAFILTVAGSEAHAQSQEKIEKANSISNVLIVSALVITAVAVILTVTKGDKKDAGKEGEQQNNPEKQEEEQKPEGQARVEPSVLSDQAVALETYETGRVNSIPDNLPFAVIENQEHLGCWRIAIEME